MTTVPADSSAALARDAASPMQPPVDVGERALLLLRLVARRWRVILIAGVLGAAGVAARQLLTPRTYTSSASIVLQGGRSSPSLSGLASQFGIALPTSGGDAMQSPMLYAEVLRSRTVLGAVANASYCDPCRPGAPRIQLSTLLEIPVRGDSGAIADATRRRLERMIAGAANARTGVVTISATAASAVLAEQMATYALTALTDFNLKARQGQAGAERRFTEGRVQDVAGELRAAEQRLKSFRESNRFAAAPELELRETQLQREVRRYEDVYSALARTLEQSKIDELRDTPAIVVIDPPSFPYRGDPRGTVMLSIFGGVVGSLLAAIAIALLALRRGLGG